MQLVNGKQSDVISIGDRGLQFGDGCFTTALVIDGQIQHLMDHLKRLQQDSQRLAIVEIDWTALQHEMLQVAEGKHLAVVKVILTRGEGGRGYSSTGCGKATRIVLSGHYPEHYFKWRKQGIRLATSPVKLSRNPQLAGIKHLNRIEQVLIRQQLEKVDAEEALVLDYEDNIVECGSANLFWREGMVIMTPALTYCGVDGIMRRKLITILENQGYTLKCLQLKPRDILTADEVFVCNALMPVLPVTQIDGKRFQLGELTQWLGHRVKDTETL